MCFHNTVIAWAILGPELSFVVTVMTSGCVKYVPAVYISPEHNAISCITTRTTRFTHTKCDFALNLLKYNTHGWDGYHRS